MKDENDKGSIKKRLSFYAHLSNRANIWLQAISYVLVICLSAAKNYHISLNSDGMTEIKSC